MKKTLIALIFFLASLPLQAQETDVLANIQNKGETISTLVSHINKSIKKKDTTKVQEGTLYYTAPNKLAALFSDGDYMIINENKMKIDIGMFHGSFKLSRNKTMRKISYIFIYGLQGNCRNLAQENDYNLSVKSEDSCHKVILVNPEEPLINIGIGYRQIVFKYSKDDLILNEIILYDFKGNIDTYTLSNTKLSVPIDKSKFEK